MDLTPYVESIRRDLAVAAEAGGDDARVLAERLTAPLESAIRLTLLDALSAAADEITRELAPGSVELRLRAGEPEFVATAARPTSPPRPPGPRRRSPRTAPTARINLRLPEQLKAGIEQAASRERLSVNTWSSASPPRARPRRPRRPPAAARGPRSARPTKDGCADHACLRHSPPAPGHHRGAARRRPHQRRRPRHHAVESIPPTRTTRRPPGGRAHAGRVRERAPPRQGAEAARPARPAAAAGPSMSPSSCRPARAYRRSAKRPTSTATARWASAASSRASGRSGSTAPPR